MADFFSGLSYGDQLEAGLATHGAADPEVWNEMLRKDADEARLADGTPKGFHLCTRP